MRLFDAIRNDKPYNEAEYGAYSTMTAILGRMATYSGQIVKWDEAIKSNHTMTTDAEKWDAEAPVKAGDDGRYAVAIPGVTNSCNSVGQTFLSCRPIVAAKIATASNHYETMQRYYSLASADRTSRIRGYIICSRRENRRAK